MGTIVRTVYQIDKSKTPGSWHLECERCLKHKKTLPKRACRCGSTSFVRVYHYHSHAQVR